MATASSSYSPPSQRNEILEETVALHETQNLSANRSGSERYLHENVTRLSIRVVVQRPRKRFFLLPLILLASTNGEEVMKALQELKNQEVSRIKLLKSVRQLLWTTVIEISKLSTFRLPDIEAQPFWEPVEVIVSSRTHSAELTAAFHRPWLLQSATPFADQYPTLLSSSHSRRTLLIGQELDRRAICWVLFTALLVSLGVGLVVGFVWSQANLAVAITGGLTGIISVLTALLVWILK